MIHVHYSPDKGFFFFFHLTGGLASHPESWYGSPSTGIGSSSANRLPNFTTPQFVNPRDLQIPTENFADKLEPHEWQDFNSLLVNHLQISSEPSEIEDDEAHSSHRTLEDFTEELVGSLNGLHASHMPRSRRSSVALSLLTDIEDEDDPMVDVVEKNPCDSCGDVEEGVTMAAIIESEKPSSTDSSLDDEQGVAMAVASILPDDAVVESKKSRSVFSEES